MKKSSVSRACQGPVQSQKHDHGLDCMAHAEGQRLTPLVQFEFMTETET